MKYLLVKGFLGFGDRLEVLAMCINFAQVNHMKLRVDWSDSVWGDSFYNYFSINIPSFEMDELTEDLSVYPAFWKGKLNEPLTEKICTENDIELQELTYYDADIIVCIGRGMRTRFLDYSFMGLKLIHPKIIDGLHERQRLYDLKNKWCIHLRGTDRFETKETREQRFRELCLKLVTRGMYNTGYGLVVMSDDIEYVKLWKARDKVSPILSKLYDTNNQGLHTIDPKDIGTTKEMLNIELLIDFFSMASCKQIFTTSLDSRYSIMAKNLKPFLNSII